MRVIAGIHRSRRLAAPADSETTRPITDRVKQALFDRLWSMGRFDAAQPAQHVLDVFCGVGSLGIEALSRGAGHCTFVERDRKIRALLEENLDRLGLRETATIVGQDACVGAWIDRVAPPSSLIFCDPPYRMTGDPNRDDVPRLVGRLAAAAASDALLVLRVERDVPPRVVEAWSGPDRHVYGSMALHFYARNDAGHST
ncbi:MAG: 16S rRNA (guanine(966)-N(2))-methyltransferase RsmD [Phycisphaeraceae bacterium]|nr:16S rRNA (guanine(966)-N(2))-methyltransferase RsmD [Phycisphaeraceae bacterium]